MNQVIFKNFIVCAIMWIILIPLVKNSFALNSSRAYGMRRLGPQEFSSLTKLKSNLKVPMSNFENVNTLPK